MVDHMHFDFDSSDESVVGIIGNVMKHLKK